MLLMVMVRSYELAHNRNVISVEKKRRIDQITLFFLGVIYFSYRKVTRSISKEIRLLPSKIHAILHFVWERVSGKIDSYFEKLRGKRGIDKRGSVSLYWQEFQDFDK